MLSRGLKMLLKGFGTPLDGLSISLERPLMSSEKS